MRSRPSAGRAFVLLTAFLVLVVSLVLMVADPGAHPVVGSWPSGDGDRVEITP